MSNFINKDITDENIKEFKRDVMQLEILSKFEKFFNSLGVDTWLTEYKNNEEDTTATSDTTFVLYLTEKDDNDWHHEIYFNGDKIIFNDLTTTYYRKLEIKTRAGD